VFLIITTVTQLTEKMKNLLKLDRVIFVLLLTLLAGCGVTPAHYGGSTKSTQSNTVEQTTAAQPPVAKASITPVSTSLSNVDALIFMVMTFKFEQQITPDIDKKLADAKVQLTEEIARMGTDRNRHALWPYYVRSAINKRLGEIIETNDRQAGLALARQSLDDLEFIISNIPYRKTTIDPDELEGEAYQFGITGAYISAAVLLKEKFGDPKKGLEYIRECARRGDRMCLNEIGYIAHFGLVGQPVDLRKAAEQYLITVRDETSGCARPQAAAWLALLNLADGVNTPDGNALYWSEKRLSIASEISVKRKRPSCDFFRALVSANLYATELSSAIPINRPKSEINDAPTKSIDIALMALVSGEINTNAFGEAANKEHEAHIRCDSNVLAMWHLSRSGQSLAATRIAESIDREVHDDCRGAKRLVQHINRIHIKPAKSS
jgi:hypothetical protein